MKDGIFKLRSDFAPSGDQPEAIKGLIDGIKDGKRYQTLLGVTGSGKTFTMANVIGGLQINEPASDLGIALALISSLTDTVIPDSLIAIGELGLAGECRGIANVEQRVKEAARLGFTKAIVPIHNKKTADKISGIEVIAVKNVYELLSVLRTQNKTKKE